MDTPRHTRRHFIQTAAALGAGTMLPSILQGAGHANASNPMAGRLYKTLKIGMIKVEGSLTDKFKAAKKAGFMGVEMNSPGMDIAETKKAIRESDFPVDGTVGSTHWKIRHSDPDVETRKEALKLLKQALRDTRAVGGHTCLLVVGKGEDGSVKEVNDRSIENIHKALPLAAELGVSICIENVWNQMHYDHGGDSNQTADELVRYVDAFDSPWVGMQFDIGNHWKYGSMGDWIRTLGKRIIKLDVKGFSRAQGKFMAIGEGDIDFADVRKALHEINYHGWCAAEVKGGDFEALKTISGQMDRVFGL
ncbi:sugar phosphate isomerase/epimerase [Opitutia bacterium ISCC 51]|nr:sugar phosphate isomerase/epimerase [Opitutae bacterium ISCC 51]QXD26800.1 sugar phosphate isomerase/epimerase [Opitutae bacterium ISCC 52]